MRTVPLTKTTVDLLAAHLAAFPAAEFEIEDRTDPRRPVTRPARFVYMTSVGRPVVRSTWGGTWAPAARKAALPAGTGLHCCGHFYASALIRFGESVKTVQHLLGHSSAKVTLDVYAHVWPDSDDRARQAIESAFADVPSVCPDAGESRWTRRSAAMRLGLRALLEAAQVTAVGAFQRATVGWFDPAAKQYRRNPVNEQCEVLSLIGDVAMGEDGPILHMHAALGLSDGTTRGGHLLEGQVYPTLEAVVTETPAELRKVMRPDIGLALIDLDRSQA